MSFNLLADETVYAADNAEPVIVWLSVAVVAALIIAGIVLFFAKRDAFAKYVKYALLGFLVYALVIGVLMLSLEIAKHYSQSYAEENWLNLDEVTQKVLIPLLVLCAVLLASAAAIYCVKRFKPEAAKIAYIVCGVLSLAALIVSIVFIAQYFTNVIKGDQYYDGGEYEEGTATVNQTMLYVCAAILVVLAVAAAFLFDRSKRGFDTRSISFAAICIAMSFALSYVKLFEMPQGGSITLASLLPLMIYSYMFGTKKGVFAGFIYGVLQAVQDPWIIHPAQFLLDYPIAFAFIGLAGMFANVKALEKYPQVKFTLGAIVACAMRYVAHVLSGVFAFSTYAFYEGFTSAWVYSLAYNSFVFVDIAIVIVAGVFVFSSKAFNKQIALYSDVKKPAAPVAEAAAANAAAPDETH